MASYPVRITGADRLARNVAEAAAMLDQDLADERRALGETAELIYAAHALHKSGRLARGIVSRDLGGVIQVEAHARNPTSGYDYVGVTRFGHRQARIYAKRRPGQHVVATGRRRGAAAALRIPMGSGVIYRRSVRGFHPASDWADRALPQVKAEAEKAASRLGRKVASRL